MDRLLLNDNVIPAFLENFTAFDIALCIGALVAVATISFFLCRPFEMVRNIGDAGYITDGWDKKEVANEIRRRRRAGDVPPVYPNGWFSLLRSSELKPGQVKYISALGQELAVYRGTRDNKPFMVDAYCPHLGANLGVGGQVIGDCIQCPFHCWTFNGADGKCMDIPYTRKVPEIAKTKAWPCLEVNNEIMMWFHAEGQEPDWQPPVIEGIRTGKLNYHGYTEHHVSCHIEDIPENGADFARLDHVHKPIVAAGRDIRFTSLWCWQWIQHTWSAAWEPDKTEKHIGIAKLTHAVKLFGIKLPSPLATVKIDAHQIGPGIVHISLHNAFLGTGVMIQTVTPLGPLHQKLVHTLYTPWTFPRFIAKLTFLMEEIQIQRDMTVLNYKTFRAKPLLVVEEAALLKHRRWYSQFYSKNSPRYSPSKETLEW